MSKSEIRSKMDFWLNHHGSFTRDRGMELTDLTVHVRQSLPHLADLSFSDFMGRVKKISENRFHIEGSIVWLQGRADVSRSSSLFLETSISYPESWPQFDYLVSSFNRLSIKSLEVTGSDSFIRFFVLKTSEALSGQIGFDELKEKLTKKTSSEQLIDRAYGLASFLLDALNG